MTGMPEITVETALRHRIITPEKLASRVQAYALEQGIPLEQAQQDIGKLVIRARRFSEKMQDGQFRHTVQLFKGANVMDVFEEFSEDSFTRALDDGFANGADLVADIRRFEDATGQQLLRSDYKYDGTNRMPLLEALSSLSRAHVLGSVRSGSLPGDVARWVELHTTLYSQTLRAARNIGSDITRAGLLRDAIASGNVSPQLQNLIADSIGIDPESIQQRLQNPRTETTGQGNGPINKSFSVDESSESPASGEGDQAKPKDNTDATDFASPSSLFVADVWEALAGHKDLFQSPRTDSRDAGEIARTLSSFANPITVEVPDGGHYVRFYSSSGEITIRQANTESPYISSANAASQGKKAGGGSLLYVAALDWIHNNEKTIRDDPGGLTEINYTRRTSNFLASALRWGTTEHLSPHDQQMIKGWSGDHHNNTALLAIAEMRNVHEKIKKSTGWIFDFQKNAFYDGTTELTKKDLEKAVGDGKPGESGIGLSTLRRAIVTATALRTAGSTSSSDLIVSKTSPFPSSLQDISYSLDRAE